MTKLALLAVWAPMASAQIEDLAPGRFPLDMEIANGEIFFVEEAAEAQVRRRESWRLPLGGGTPELVDPGSAGAPTVPGTSLLDVEGAYLYGTWADRLQRQATFGAGVITSDFDIVTDFTNVVVDFDTIWSSVDGTLRRRPRSGAGSLVTVPFGRIGFNTMVEDDAGGVYFVGQSSTIVEFNDVFRWDGSGAPEVAETTAIDAKEVAVDDTHLWWIAKNVGQGPRVYRTPRGGGADVLRASVSNTEAEFSSLAMDDDSVYLLMTAAGQTLIRRFAKDGSTGLELVATIGNSAGHLRVDEDFLYWRDEIGIRRIRKDTSAPLRDLRWGLGDEFDVVQSVQGDFDAGNDESVELIQGRPTLVRAFPVADVGAVLDARAVLHAFMPDGTPLGDVESTVPFATVLTNPINRAVLSRSFNFLLPESWTRMEEIQVEIELDPSDDIAESDESNNRTNRRSLSFRDPTHIRLFFVPVRTHAPLYRFGDDSFFRILERAKSLLPMTDITPVAVSGVAPESGKRWPLVISAAFTQTLSPERWKELRWRFFRL
ncbi:MAG: hypothetical protein ACIARR_05185, partial [Phycisphaerales bacterium JB059]